VASPVMAGGLPDDGCGLVDLRLWRICRGRRRGEELGPVEAGGFGGKVGEVPGVVGFVDVFAVGEGDLLLCDGMSRTREHASHERPGQRGRREAKHGGDVGLVFFADFFMLSVVARE